jgi:hypothetical protein
MSLSTRHHYIPIFYLKGFLNNNNEFAIFDKKRKVLKKGYFSPKSHFFEDNRNTLIDSEGELCDSLEQLYMEYDTKMSKLFERLRLDTEGSYFLNSMNIQELKFFIAQMFWRIPESDSLFERFFEGKSPKELGVEIRQHCGETDIEAPQEMQEGMFDNPNFRKMCRHLTLPLNTFKILLQESDINNWNYYYGDSEPISLCSDNPIVFKNPTQFFDFQDDLILPLTAKKILVFTRNKKPSVLTLGFKANLDLMLFNNANRYVCGPNRDYLNKVAETYYKFDKKISYEQLKRELFSPFE